MNNLGDEEPSVFGTIILWTIGLLGIIMFGAFMSREQLEEWLTREEIVPTQLNPPLTIEDIADPELYRDITAPDDIPTFVSPDLYVQEYEFDHPVMIAFYECQARRELPCVFTYNDGEVECIFRGGLPNIVTLGCTMSDDYWPTQ